MTDDRLSGPKPDALPGCATPRLARSLEKAADTGNPAYAVRGNKGQNEARTGRQSPGIVPEPPFRVQLSRAKGWRMPPNTVGVARPGKLGNPFVVGVDGTRAECVELYRIILAGYLALTSKATIDAQKQAVAAVREALPILRGKNLACWCRLDGKPCHADVLLELANPTRITPRAGGA